MVAAWRSGLDPAEIPTAEVIARAIVAASRQLGEDPLRFAADGQLSRAVKVAFHVLHQFYPLYPQSRLSLILGMGAAGPQIVGTARKAAWWHERRDAFAAAADALEAA